MALCHEDVWGSGVIYLSFLTLAADVREDSFTTQLLEPPSTHWIGGLVGRTIRLDVVEKKKKSCLFRNQIKFLSHSAHEKTKTPWL
jgi:hypothetical protein